MEQDLICAEGELAIAVNSVERYAEFLAKCMDEFSDILSSITDENILKDVLICAAVKTLSVKVFLEKDAVVKSMDNIKAIVKQEIQELEDVDKFDYPDFTGGDIKALLFSFL